MALVSVAPLVSMRRPSLSSTYELKALHRKTPNPGMHRQRKSATRFISMRSTTSVSSDDAERRRVGDYHYNQWDDDVIDSLATSYEVVN